MSFACCAKKPPRRQAGSGESCSTLETRATHFFQSRSSTLDAPDKSNPTAFVWCSVSSSSSNPQRPCGLLITLPLTLGFFRPEADTILAGGVSHQIEPEFGIKGRSPTHCVGLRPFAFVVYTPPWLTPWARAVSASGLKSQAFQ